MYFIWFAKSIIDHKSIKTLDALCNNHYNRTIKGINGLLRLILKLEEATLTDRSYIDFNNISESDIVNIENHKCWSNGRHNFCNGFSLFLVNLPKCVIVYPDFWIEACLGLWSGPHVQDRNIMYSIRLFNFPNMKWTVVVVSVWLFENTYAIGACHHWCVLDCRLVHGAVPRRLLSLKTARPKLLSANATVTKCKMDWNTVSTARTFRNFPLYCKTLLHSEAFTGLHVYSCKRMYIASALFYCNSNRISHMSRCVSQFSVLDDGQILIIHKKQEIKQIFSNTTIIYWEYQLFVNKKMSHILLLFYFHEKNQVTVTIGSMHRLLYILSPTNNMKNMHVNNDFRKKLLFT